MVVADDGLRWKATRCLGWCPRKAKATAPLDPSRQSRGKAKATARTMAHAAVKKNAEKAEAGNDEGREVRTRKVGGNSSERVGAEASRAEKKRSPISFPRSQEREWILHQLARLAGGPRKSNTRACSVRRADQLRMWARERLRQNRASSPARRHIRQAAAVVGPSRAGVAGPPPSSSGCRRAWPSRTSSSKSARQFLLQIECAGLRHPSSV
jgi:hypothetical protein